MFRDRFIRIGLSGSASALAIALAAAPMAAHAATAPAADSNATQVGEVIVTSNKRAESVQNTVGAITALSAQTLKTQGIHTVDDISQHTPGMTFYTLSGTAFITLRGVGVPVSTGASDPNTAVNVDGVNLPRTSEMTITNFDMDRVEISRGPQGTLYGRNSIGGAVNFVSKQPTHTFTAEMNVGGGNYDRWDAHGYVSGPLNSADTIRGLISVENTGQGQGFVKDLYNGETLDKDQTWGVRAALSFDLAPNVKLDLSAETQHEEYNQFQQIMGNTIDACIGPTTGPCGGGAAAVPNLRYSLAPWTVVSAYVRPSNKQTQVYSATLNWDIAKNLHFRSITGSTSQFNDKGLDGSETVPTSQVLPDPSDGTPYKYEEPSYYYSQEFNLLGEFGHGGTWVVGLFASDEQYRIDIPVYVPNFGAAYTNPDPSNPLLGTDFSLNYNARFHEATQAIFGDITIPITDRFRILGGLRVAHEENDTNQVIAVTVYAPGFYTPHGGTAYQNGCAFLTGGAVNDAEYNQSWTPVTPRAGFQFDFTDQVKGYFTWSKGFKDGGVSPTACGNTFAPEYLTSYEAGLKSTLLDGKLVMNMAIYRYDYSGMQVYEGIGTSASIVVNGNSQINGVDAEILAHITHDLSMDIEANYLNDFFTNFASDDASDPSNSRGLPTVTENVGGVPTQVVSLRGLRLPGVPDYNITAGLQNNFPVSLGVFDHLLARVEGNFVGTTDTQPWGRPETVQHPYVKLNAVLQLAGHDGWTVRVYGRNLTNAATSWVVLYNGGVNFWNGQYSPPRTFGIELTKDFGG